MAFFGCKLSPFQQELQLLPKKVPFWRLLRQMWNCSQGTKRHSKMTAKLICDRKIVRYGQFKSFPQGRFYEAYNGHLTSFLSGSYWLPSSPEGTRRSSHHEPVIDHPLTTRRSRSWKACVVTTLLWYSIFGLDFRIYHWIIATVWFNVTLYNHHIVFGMWKQHEARVLKIQVLLYNDFKGTPWIIIFPLYKVPRT